MAIGVKAIKMNAWLFEQAKNAQVFGAYGGRKIPQCGREVFATGPLAPVIDREMQSSLKLTFVTPKVLFSF